MARLGLCLGCRRHYDVVELRRGKGRCSACAKVKQRERDQRRGSPAERGYGTEWRKLRDSLIAAHPYCAECRHPGRKDNPLSVDQIVQRQHGGSDDPSNLRVLCLDCNKRRPQHNPTEPRPRFSRSTLTGVESAGGNDDAPSVA